MSDYFWHNIFNRNQSDLDIITDLWQKTPLFKQIPRRQIRKLADNMHIRQFNQDEVVFKQGDQGAGAILLVEGKVRIQANDAVLAELNPGDFFGEITLAETDKRTADAYCSERCRLVYFLKADLEEWIDIEPRLGTRFLMNLASTLAQRLHLANQKLSEEA